MEDKLLPIHEIVRLAKEQGVDFGKGNPQNRLRYLTKHSLIPQAKRKLPPGSINPKSTIAHYPTSIIKRLKFIHLLRKKGLPVHRIKQLVGKEYLVLEEEALKVNSLLSHSREVNELVLGSAVLESMLEFSIRNTFPALLLLGIFIPILIPIPNLDFPLRTVFVILLRSLVAPNPLLYFYFS